MAGSIIAGLEPGGLRETYEVKILVCYLLSSIRSALTFEQLCEVCTEDGVTDYFTLSAAVSDLVDSGQLLSKPREDGVFLHLTGLGEETAQNLKQALPSSLRDKIVRRGIALLSKLRKENEVSVKVAPCEKGFEVRCSIHEGDLEFMSLTLYAPDREQAGILAKNFYDRSTAVYQGLLKALTE